MKNRITALIIALCAVVFLLCAPDAHSDNALYPLGITPTTTPGTGQATPTPTLRPTPSAFEFGVRLPAVTG